MSERSFKTENYIVNLHQESSDDLIVVFTSAGIEAIGGPIEEFKGSLGSLGCSMLFVIDLRPAWLNHPETADVLARVAEIASDFQNVGAMGESMGASSAIAFTNFFPEIDRVLAFSPQYSVAAPFVRFDTRFSYLADRYPRQYWPTFSVTPNPEKVVSIFSNMDWNDTVHAAMFSLDGVEPVFVHGSEHEVARFLKRHSDGNLLKSLLSRFVDFTNSFTASTVKDALQAVVTTKESCQSFNSSSERMAELRFIKFSRRPVLLPTPAGCENVAIGKPTNQSSVYGEQGKTTQQDSAGAVTGKPTGTPGFHTANEDRPWWSVDLGKPFEIAEVRVFNRIENLAAIDRNLQFSIEAKDYDLPWREVSRRDTLTRFGGVDGDPFIWTPPERFVASAIRFRLLGTGFLHFDQVEIYGTPC